MNPIGLASVIATLAAISRTHSHCIQSDYEEERDRLLAQFPDEREECERAALDYVRKKFTDKAEHLRRLSRGKR